MFQKMAVAIILGLFLPLALSVSVSAYPSTVNVVSNEAGFSTSVIKCTDTSCSQLTSLTSERSDITSGTNKNTYTVTGSGPQTFVEYDYMACRDPHIFINDFDDATGPGPHQFDVTFSQKQGCTAPIEELKAGGNLVEGQNPIPFVVSVKSAFDYPVGAEGAFIPNNLRAVFGSETKLNVTIVFPDGIVSPDGQINTRTSVTELVMGRNILFVSDFQYTGNGTYIIKAKTEVTDCACSSQTPQEKEITVQVADTSPIAEAGLDHFAVEGLLLGFDGSASKEAFDKIIEYVWDFGDGSKSSGQKANHTYLSNGTYTVTLTATDSDGSQSTDTLTAKISDSSATAFFFPDTTSGDEPLTVTFTDASITNADQIIQRFWDFGDGTNSTESSPSHTFIVKENVPVKEFVVTLTVTDSDGSMSTFSRTVTVNKVPLSAAFVMQNPVSIEGQEIAFDASGSSGPISEYLWDFGDGTNATDNNTVFHVYKSNGTYTVSLAVKDVAGNADVKKLKIFVEDTAPNITIKSNITGPFTEGPVTFDASGTTAFDQITGFFWVFRKTDGSFETNITGPVINVTLADGDYERRLEVIDSDGSASVSSGLFEVSDSAPFASFTFSPQSPVSEGTEITFTDTTNAGFDQITIKKFLAISLVELLKLPKINVTMYTSFESPFAKTLYEDIKAAKQSQNPVITLIGSLMVNFDYKHFTLDSIFPNARGAAEAAECARDQGQQALFGYADTLYKFQDILEFTNSTLKQFASDMGLDITKFNPCFDGREKKQKVDSDEAEAISLGIIGIPTTFVNSIQITGAHPTSVFQRSLISEALRLWPFTTPIQTTKTILTQNDTYLSILFAEDSDSSQSHAESSIEAADLSPSVTLTAPQIVFTNQPADFSAIASSPADNIISIEWDFGDGQTGLGKLVSHTYITAGNFTVTVRVQDSDSETVKSMAVEAKNLVHDISVSGASMNRSAIYLFDHVNLSLSVSNKGTVAESVSVLLKDSSNTLSTKTLSLSAGETANISFVWVPDSEGLHILSLEAAPVAGETATLDNQMLLSADAISVKNSISLDFVNPSSFPAGLEPANSSFFVWVKVSKNTLKSIANLKVKLNSAGLSINKTQDGNFEPEKLYQELSGVRTYWWKLDSGQQAVKNISVEIGNGPDKIFVSKEVNIN